MVAAATMFLLMLLVAIFYLRSGHNLGAGIAFLLAAASPVSIILALWGARSSARRTARDRIVLDADPEMAAEWTMEAFNWLAGDMEQEIYREELTAYVETPRTWKSMGERVSATVRGEGTGSIVEVMSTSKWPQLVDYGKNRANVRSVILRLASRNPRLP